MRKAKQRASLIPRCFYTRNKNILFKAFTTYVRPLLEYCCSVWSPNQCNLLDKIEGIQRNFTKKLFGLQHVSYKDRLVALNAERLKIRRIKADLLLYFKIFHKFIDLDENHFCVLNKSVTRGHQFKIQKKHAINNNVSNLFCNRSVNVWNKLPTHVVLSCSLPTFKNRLRNCDIIRNVRAA